MSYPPAPRQRQNLSPPLRPVPRSTFRSTEAPPLAPSPRQMVPMPALAPPPVQSPLRGITLPPLRGITLPQSPLRGITLPQTPRETLAEMGRPRGLLDDINLTVYNLVGDRNLTYDEFLADILDSLAGTNTKLSADDFKVIEYPFPEITISFPRQVSIYDSQNKPVKVHHKLFSNNPTGFTKGDLLYILAQMLPSDNEWGDYVYFEGLSLNKEGVYTLSLGS